MIGGRMWHYLKCMCDWRKGNGKFYSVIHYCNVWEKEEKFPANNQFTSLSPLPTTGSVCSLCLFSYHGKYLPAGDGRPSQWTESDDDDRREGGDILVVHSWWWWWLEGRKRGWAGKLQCQYVIFLVTGWLTINHHQSSSWCVVLLDMIMASNHSLFHLSTTCKHSNGLVCNCWLVVR